MASLRPKIKHVYGLFKAKINQNVNSVWRAEGQELAGIQALYDQFKSKNLPKFEQCIDRLRPRIYKNLRSVWPA